MFLFLVPFFSKAQIYQSMPQAGYGPVKRMLFDSVLTLPLGITRLQNISGGRDTGQIRYNKADSSIYTYSGNGWRKVGGSTGSAKDSTFVYANFTPTSGPAYQQGRLWYDSVQQSIAFYNDVNLSPVYVGENIVLKVFNNTGATIAKGAAVYIQSAGAFTYPNVALAQANAVGTASVIGLMNAATPSGSFGYVTSTGVITGVNTGSYAEGTVLYLSPYSAGQLMNTVPPTGYVIQVGVVAHSNTPNGTIYTKQTTPLAISANIITGTLAVNQGGTGSATALTQGGIMYGSSTTAMASTAAGTAGQLLRSNGTGAPSWVSVDTISLSNRINGKVSKIGDTMTGNLSLQNFAKVNLKSGTDSTTISYDGLKSTGTFSKININRTSNATDTAGITVNTINGNAIEANGINQYGLKATSTNSNAIWAESQNGAGLYSTAQSGNGVTAQSATGVGVEAISTTGTALTARTFSSGSHAKIGNYYEVEGDQYLAGLEVKNDGTVAVSTNAPFALSVNSSGGPHLTVGTNYLTVHQTGRTVLGESDDLSNRLQVGGAIRSTALAGTGTRDVVANSSGVMSTAPRWVYVPKNNTTTIQSNINFADDPELKFSVPVGSKAEFRAEIYFTGSDAADFKYRHNVTNVLNGGVIVRSQFTPPTTNSLTTPVTRSPETTFQGSNISVTWTVVATQHGYISLTGFVDAVGASGNMDFAFQWAQASSAAANTSVLRGSYIEYIITQ